MAHLRIIFMATPGFAVPALAGLAAAGHEIVAVYTRPPRPAGRGHGVRKSEVHQLAEKLGLHVETPALLRDEAAQKTFAAFNADIAVVAAYGLILPKPVLAAPRFGCLNIHASLLPRWRGAAPIHRAILAGDRKTGITIMQMDEGLDTGAILMMERVAIAPDMNGGALHDVLARLGADLIVRAVAARARDRLEPRAQPDFGITYAAKIAREETRIVWTAPVRDIHNQVRAFAPTPGAWCEIRGERIKILSSRVLSADAHAYAPGTILSPLTIACGEGLLALERLQRAGREALDADMFLRGFDLAFERAGARHAT